MDELRRYKDIPLKSYDGVKCNCLVTRVIDGDTVEIVFKTEDGRFEKHRLRIEGINAPETRTRDADEKTDGMRSKKELTNLVDRHKGEAYVSLKKDDKYGRRLGQLFMGDIDIGKYMVDNGFANVAHFERSVGPI